MITIIPAIDIIDGKCVRLSKGDYHTQKVYSEDPVNIAKQFEDAGFKRLHLVDLDGAGTGAVKNWDVLERIASATRLVIDFSGGISQYEHVLTALNSGAQLVSIGSVAVKSKQTFLEWISSFGADKFLLGADVRNDKVVTAGWTETSAVDVYELINTYLPYGINTIFCTDVSKDGMLEGPASGLYEKIIERFDGLKLIASGGVSSVSDIELLDNIGCDGIIIGKAFYEGKIKPGELRRYVD
jgi:phosphoribosylformimino-5-aminoimidazole carboxamide ribotide isomerase